MRWPNGSSAGSVLLMMIGMQRKLRLECLCVGLCLLVALPGVSADLIDRVEDVYTARRLRLTPFQPRAESHLDLEESRFLESIFTLTDEASQLNVNVGRWFQSTGERGLHPEDCLERMDDLRVRLVDFATPMRVESVRDLIAEAFGLQRDFVHDWYEALEAGRPFESQLTNEYAYHEGLHRSHRVLLKAFAELHALFPEVGETTHMAFHDHLRAVDWR
jgi:hypothetical protein